MFKNHKGRNHIIRFYAFLLFCFGVSGTIYSQGIGDYISLGSGPWSTTATWGVVTGTGPLTWSAAAGAPSAGNNVWVRTGNTVALSFGTSYFCTNLNVVSGGKLYTNDTITTPSSHNTYISLTGNITCNGQIGNFPTFDNISFNIDGANCLITGTGSFDASRMRKNSAAQPTTNLTIDMNINLWFPTNSTTQIYNNTASASYFNLTVTSNAALNLLSTAGFTGHASIDGLDGGFASVNTVDLAGTWTINGTMLISGKLYLGTNNPTAAYKCNWVINGLLQVNEIVAGASGLGGSTLTVNAGAKLEITGPAAWSSLSITNNVFTYASGSTEEYSATGNQVVRVASEFGATASQYYGNLICSNTGNRTCNVATLQVKNDLRISGSAVLIPFTASNVFVGGNWYNYNQSGYTEGTSRVFFNNAIAVPIGQNINCPGGEVFYNLVQNSANNTLTFNTPVTVTSQLSLASTNGHVDLNSNSLTLFNSTSSAITGGGINRYIISEKTDNSSKVIWKIGTGIGPYTFPFGIPPSSSTNYIPVIINKTTAVNVGDITISTYGTGQNNQPWPTTPTLVTNLWADNSVHNVPDDRSYTVDRFWQVNATVGAAVDSLKFSYRTSELPDSDLVPANMRAQRWVSGISYWDRNQYGVPAVITSPSTNQVSVPGFNIWNTAWTLSSTVSPLPVELLSFNAIKQAENVELNWSTATELNNDFFTLERGKNGRNFYPIATIRGAGNSTTTINYSYVDEKPFTGISYYRLKQTDFDGRYHYSQTAVVNFGKGKNNPALFPNPSTSEIFLTGVNITDARLIVYDLKGSKIKDQAYSESDSGVYRLDIDDLPKGIYLLDILNTTEQYMLKLIKE